MVNFAVNNIDWTKMNNLIPAIVQDKATKEILMLGYMNQEALTQTLETKQVTFYSRRKKALWVKGEISGNTLELCDITSDCDQDSLLLLVKPLGPTCHKGSQSCFDSPGSNKADIIMALEQTIELRRKQEIEGSYVCSLFQEGMSRIAQKVGEEGVEVALAAVQGDKKALCEEVADLLFHTLVLLQANKLTFDLILQILQERNLKKAK